MASSACFEASGDEIDQRILGRSPGDAERLFPRYTAASAAYTTEVTVNGKALKIWEFAQLEALSVKVLQQRARTIREAVGDEACDPLPSNHATELVRWIVNMQAKLISRSEVQVGRPGPGRVAAVPHVFAQENQVKSEDQALRDKLFGVRHQNQEHPTGRDSYRDLKERRNEFTEADDFLRRGIVSARRGGEGRRHLSPDEHMDAFGFADTDEVAQGRRHIRCPDNVKEQIMQANDSPSQDDMRRMLGGPPDKHVTQTGMLSVGVSEPVTENIQRRGRCPQAQASSMVGVATSAPLAEPGVVYKRPIHSFAGPNTKDADAHSTYQSTWKKAPSRLKGASLLV